MNRLLDLVTVALAALLLTAMALLSIRGMLDPRAAAHAFGVAASDEAAAFYHAVYRDRNLVLAATGLAFLFASMWRALAILATVSVTLPAYDIVVLKLANVLVAPAHPITLGALVALAVLLWIRVTRAPRGSAPPGPPGQRD